MTEGDQEGGVGAGKIQGEPGAFYRARKPSKQKRMGASQRDTGASLIKSSQWPKLKHSEQNKCNIG